MNDDHQQAEREFFDRYYLAHQESKPSLNGFYALSAGARTYGDRVLEHCAGLRVLEYGCGLGGYALRLAERGADVTGIDISEAAIEQASRRAAALGPGMKIRFQNADAEALPFDNASFDLICGSGIVHHLDIHRALSEVRRVLAPGGRALFYEPGAHHPAARLYRHLTPDRHTPGEHPLTRADLRLIASYFPFAHIEHFDLVSVAAIPFLRRRGGVALLRFLEAIDRTTFALLPFARVWASVLVIAVRAGPEGAR
ncbi:MAG TPA: class I SAM-dependent methyltransferase [Thermoanaerobaculia bacterium]|nr:class I SAM-dependent methyltransferase [Thermoanaerobaculia bacterium]